MSSSSCHQPDPHRSLASQLQFLTMAATPCTERTSRVLIIGASGFMGHFIAQASLDSGQTTYVLTRSSSALWSSKIKALHDNGAVILHVPIRIFILSREIQRPCATNKPPATSF
ncbi:putative leucoanthocyanidin reductase [Helianthus annuus]|nr:putative leucoanthocyanidin reductase [Helianthus annuus]